MEHLLEAVLDREPSSLRIALYVADAPVGSEKNSDSGVSLQELNSIRDGALFAVETLPIFPRDSKSCGVVMASRDYVEGGERDLVFAFIVPVDQCTPALARDINHVIGTHTPILGNPDGRDGPWSNHKAIVPMQVATNRKTGYWPHVFLCRNYKEGIREVWWPFVLRSFENTMHEEYGPEETTVGAGAVAIMDILCQHAAIKRYLHVVIPSSNEYDVPIRHYGPEARAWELSSNPFVGQMKSYFAPMGKDGLHPWHMWQMQYEDAWPIPRVPVQGSPAMFDPDFAKFLRTNRYRLQLMLSRESPWSVLPPDLVRDHIDPMMYRAPSARRSRRSRSVTGGRRAGVEEDAKEIQQPRRKSRGRG